MKTKGSFGLAILLGLLLAGGAWAQDVTPTQIFMRKKLGFSQNIVEGIALEHYGLVVTNGMRMWRMTQTNTWTNIKNKDYIAKTQKFQDDTADLVDAARAKDTGKMLESYSRVTADCVNCHQMVRREQAAPRLSPAATNSLAAQKPPQTPPPPSNKK